MQGTFLDRARISTNWLFNAPLKGPLALVVSVAAIAIPTIVRMAMSPQVDDQACTIFCPFVLLTVILCGWRYAVVVAVGGALACNTILMGRPYMFHFNKAEFEGLATFLAYSGFMILVVQLFRATAARSLRQAGAKESASGIVFSLDGGQAWASWYGIDAPVRLGSPDEVVPIMKDFIAQVELGKHFEAGFDARATAMG